MTEAWSKPWTHVNMNETPAKARAVALEIVAQLDSPRDQTHRQRNGGVSFGRLTTSDGHGGIAILGDRGSGKSTVLHAVCAELDSRGKDIVLPVVYPELFRETDSVLGTFLAMLWERAQAGTSDSTLLESVNESNESLQLLRLILDAAHIFAMAQTPARALENSSLSPEYVDEVVAITRSSTRLHRILADVTRAVSDNSGGGLLILPIDDADLSPVGVSGVMRDLRIIGSIPGIMPIACASEEDLHSSWTQEQSVGDISPHQVNSFRRYLEKLFPYRFRFEIEPLLTTERVDFTPIGTDVSVAELAERFDDAVDELTSGASPLRPLRAGAPGLSLVNPLPPNPRALIQVWDSLESATNRGSIEGLSLGLRRIIQIVSEPVDDATDSVGIPRFARVSPSSNSKDLRFRVDFNVDSWNLFISADPFATVSGGAVSEAAESSSQARIQLRRVQGVHTSLVSTGSSDAAASSGAVPHRMTPTVTSAALTIQEFVARSNLMDRDHNGLLIGHDDYRFLQSVEIAGLKTDDLFVTLPDLATYSAVQSGAERWNAVVDHVRAQQPDVRTLLRLTLAAVLSQTRGTQLEFERLPSYAELFADVTAMFHDALNVERTKRSEEQRRLIEWYMQGPPLHWHTALLPVTTIAEVVAVWTEAVSRLQGDDVRTVPMALLRVRIERILDSAEATSDNGADHVWVAGYFSAVAGHLEPKLYQRLAQIYPAWRQRWTIVRTGSTSAFLSLDVERGSTSIVFSPYPTQTGIELFDSARAQLRRLRTSAAQGGTKLVSRQ
jgi:hypothetical protein